MYPWRGNTGEGDVTSPLGDVGLWGEFEGGWKISISLARRRFLLEKRLNVVGEFFRLSAYLTAIINRKIELGVRVRVSQLPVRLYQYEYAVPQFQYPRDVHRPQRKLAMCCLAGVVSFHLQEHRCFETFSPSRGNLLKSVSLSIRSGLVPLPLMQLTSVDIGLTNATLPSSTVTPGILSILMSVFF